MVILTVLKPKNDSQALKSAQKAYFRGKNQNLKLNGSSKSGHHIYEVNFHSESHDKGPKLRLEHRRQFYGQK